MDQHVNVSVHHQPLQGDALVEAMQDGDAVVLARDRTPVNAALVHRLPRLRYLMFTVTRDTTLAANALAALAACNIRVSHIEWGPSKDSAFELTWSLILRATRRLVVQTTPVQRGEWRAAQPKPLADVMHGQTLRLIELGEIGSRVARVGQALGVNVISWCSRMTPERAARKRAASVPLDELLSMSKVVSLHCVPTAPTRQLPNVLLTPHQGFCDWAHLPPLCLRNHRIAGSLVNRATAGPGDAQRAPRLTWL